MKNDGVDTEIINEYFRYLCNLVGADTIAGGHYWYLLRQLHSIQFYWIIPFDENRASDGENLRVRFFYERNSMNHDYEEFLFEPCSVLEMMIALAIRENDYLMDWRAGAMDKTADYFWEMIGNLGLLQCVDDTYSTSQKALVQHVIERFMEHDFEYNGLGGLFPLESPSCDQRCAEIWHSMLSYISERHLAE